MYSETVLHFKYYHLMTLGYEMKYFFRTLKY